MSRQALAVCVLLCVASVASAVEPAQVRLPLDQWQQAIDAVRELERPITPEHPFAVVRRNIDVSFARGVLTGTMDAEIDVDTIDATVTVPLLDEEASLSSISVDGAHAVATRGEGMNAVLIATKGRHRVHLTFAKGQDEDRFTRGFSLSLPSGPVTRVIAALPEADVEAELDGGVILAQSKGGTGTRIEAAMGGAGGLSLHWRRRAAEASSAKRELEARMFVLASVHEQTVRTRTTIAYRVLSGEASRFELAIPDGVEVTGVTGDAVLQWTAERRGDDRIVSVLLKYLVDDASSIDVATQHPRGSGGAAELKLVRALGTTLREGFIALEGRAGFELAVTESDAAEMATADLPSELLSATDKPLLAAFRFEKEPHVSVTVTRNEQVELTQAVIDSLDAVTIVGEEGVEIVKLRLMVRNNTRQYLGVALPPDSHVTHALIDGAPIQPAVTKTDGGEVLLVPLRQSEKLASRRRHIHIVQPGDTLSGIALRYFNRSDRAAAIAAANGGVRADNLQVGQSIVVPSGGSAVQESSFVVELAYETRRAGLSTFGRRILTLPSLDIAVMAVHWSTYLPDAYEPLRFATDLRQLDSLRYDPFTRLRYYIETALASRSAWAGASGVQYENILRSRKMIYAKEQKKQATVALTSFPLVGERYRFTRVLLGTERAKLDISYVRRSVQPWVRGAVFVCTFLALWVWLTGNREKRRMSYRNRDFAVLLAVLALATVLGHFVLGVHRTVLLALDIGLLVFLLHDVWRRWKPATVALHQTQVFKRSFRGRWLLRFVVLVAVAYALVLFPMFWSLAALLLLSWAVTRRVGVRHA